MRQETNNEMDLLLRRLGRRQDVLAPDAEDHLDADDLNAYAENALPAAARARYTEHIADCSRCRELVVQLSASAGVVNAGQTVALSELSGWRKFLASLLSPMVLRYAAPALGLIVVAVISVVVMRRQSSNEYVSQVQKEEVKSAGVPESAAAPAQQPAVNSYSDPSSKPADSSVAGEKETKNATQPTATPATPAQEKAPAVEEQNEPAPRRSSEPVAAAAPPPRPAKVETTTDEKQRENDDAPRRQPEAQVKVAPAEVSKKDFELGKTENKRAEGSADARARTAKSKPATGDVTSAGVGSVARGRRDRVEGADKDSDAETRSVAGRRFRKQGNIWIDTAYDSSRNTVSLRRGSEQYRGLIADEPSIKTIADQLDGEIIVVWKGRTYRIQ